MIWQASFSLAPVAKGRARIGKFGAYTPAKTRKAEGELRYFISQNSPVFFDGPIDLSIRFIITRPASISAKKRPHPTTRPDLDNYIKTVLDASNGLLWKDDAQIVRLVAEKVYGTSPSIEITVKSFEALACLA